MKLANAKLYLTCDEVYETNRLQYTNGYCPKCLEKHSAMLKDYILPLHNYVKEEIVRRLGA